MNRFYVVGTDTGIGKTVFSTILMHYFYIKGLNPFYFKPFQTGCAYPLDADSDATFVYKNLPQLRESDPAISVGYCFAAPKAPYFAARDEKKEIDMDWIKNTINERAKGHNPVIIEGSGGLLVPVTKDVLILDTIKTFDAAPILIARAGLGTINHTLLSLEAIKRMDIKPRAVIFMDNEDTPDNMIEENIEAIEIFSKVKVAGVIRRIIDLSLIRNEIFAFLDSIFSEDIGETP